MIVVSAIDVAEAVAVSLDTLQPTRLRRWLAGAQVVKRKTNLILTMVVLKK